MLIGLTFVTIRLIVRGRVQGVSFRASMHEKASRLGVSGWVRNMEDGSVEALVQGEVAAVSRMVEWARSGPVGARVSSLEEHKLASYPRQKGFTILF